MRILAVDLGTSSIKVMRTDEHGAAIALDRVPMQTLDVDAWMTALTNNIQVHGDGASITAISITGQMHGLLTLEHGGAWGEGIPWYDQRSADMLPVIRQQLGDRAITTTGGPLATGFLAASLAWIRANDSARWSRILQVFLPKDALIHELTDRHVADPTDAVGTGLFAPERGGWAWELVSALRIPRPWLPDIIASGSVAGNLTYEAAEALGLPAGIPVICAGGDAAVGAFGAGVTHGGDALVMLSSGAQIILPTAAWVPDPRGRWYTWPSVARSGSDGTRYLRVGTLLNAGNALDWADSTLREGDLPADPSGLIALPHLIGTRVDPSHRGAILGITPDTTPGQIRRAVIEGIAFSIRRTLEEMIGPGERPSRIRIGGGLARLPAIRQLFADVLGWPVEDVGQPDLSARGAALLALSTLGEAPPTSVSSGICHPEPVHTGVYQRMYAHYCDADDVLGPMLARLGSHNPGFR